MSATTEAVRLTKLQARTLLGFLERKGLGLEQGDPVKEIWAEVDAFANGSRGLECLTEIWQRHRLSAMNATCVGLNHNCVNAAVFLVLYGFCREGQAYRPAHIIPWLALGVAFKAGQRRSTDDDRRLLFDELEEALEAAYEGAGIATRGS